MVLLLRLGKEGMYSDHNLPYETEHSIIFRAQIQDSAVFSPVVGAPGMLMHSLMLFVTFSMQLYI